MDQSSIQDLCPVRPTAHAATNRRLVTDNLTHPEPYAQRLNSAWHQYQCNTSGSEDKGTPGNGIYRCRDSNLGPLACETSVLSTAPHWFEGLMALELHVILWLTHITSITRLLPYRQPSTSNPLVRNPRRSCCESIRLSVVFNSPMCSTVHA